MVLSATMQESSTLGLGKRSKNSDALGLLAPSGGVNNRMLTRHAFFRMRRRPGTTICRHFAMGRTGYSANRLQEVFHAPPIAL